MLQRANFSHFAHRKTSLEGSESIAPPVYTVRKRALITARETLVSQRGTTARFLLASIFHSDWRRLQRRRMDRHGKPCTAGGGMLINQHDTSRQDDLPTRVDEVGNFLIYILHGGYMHNLVARVGGGF